ncbi:hypothetical protein EGI26_01100 [Lacihabitans sp. CCS-44]|uniref:AAA family ATPase n=1 Tax=Lacihabitans sp. CCS-44 TaxID=2487331 RepID=UPI0020CB8BAD|nr:AAA family ATPase [Lacihabitans sp. CCS-44]MCP9753760.1 hypothetical protein [Lacihabitans sp. CCS-44]
MQRIIVKNFGPLKDIDLEIKDFMVLIGPNASGKSTLAKLIFAFQSLPQFLNEFTENYFRKPNSDFRIDFYNDFEKKLLPLFFNENLSVEFLYNDQLTIRFDNNYSSEIISTSYIFRDNLTLLFSELESHRLKSDELQNSKITNQELNIRLKELSAQLRSVISMNFHDSKRLHYFISENKQFFNLQNSFNSNYSEILNRAKTKIRIEGTNSLLFKNKILEKNLKGLPYLFNDTDFGIRLENSNDFVNFENLSSGQKENFWFLISLIVMKENFSPSSLFIEEPENHLFPEAQKDILEFLIEFFNQLDLKLLITTHSHYLIGVINVLINAHRIGQNNPDKVEKVIPKDYWLDKERVFIGRLKDGELKSVYSEEAEIFDHEELTQTSGILNDEYGQLLEIEYDEDK